MKRTVVLAILLFASTAFASGGRPHKPNNFDIFGSNDRQRDRTEYVVRKDDNRMWDSVTPMTPVPEPATLLLLGAGMIALAAAGRRRK